MPTDAGLPSHIGNQQQNERRVNLCDLMHLQETKQVSFSHRELKHKHSPLPPLNSGEELIKAYPDYFKGIGKLPRTYHMTLRDYTKSVIHTPRKCPIAMLSLVHNKLDEIINDEITIPVKEPTDWVSSLAYSWKTNGQLHMCLDPKDLNLAIKWDHYRPQQWRKSQMNWLEAPISLS